MFIQQTFKNNQPTIFLVGTPIGNLSDMSFRAIEVLQSVDVILCEDTRTSKPLLTKYQINKPLLSLHKFNEHERKDKIIELLDDGQNLALISDAGVPAISDPGAELIHQLRWVELIDFNASGVNAGPAYVHALVAAGFTNRTNYFHGFIQNKTTNSKTNELTAMVESHQNEIVSFYESVHRIKDTLQILAGIYPSIPMTLNRELTKLNEEIIYGTVEEVNRFVQGPDFIQKGEFVVVLDLIAENQVYQDSELLEQLQAALDEGLKLKEAAKKVSDLTGVGKNYLYDLFLKQ